MADCRGEVQRRGKVREWGTSAGGFFQLSD
jgi:hypothetical protein